MSAREELFRRVAGAFVSEDRANKLIDDVIAEAAPEVAALRASLEEMTRCRDNALRALYRDDVETDVDLEETIAAPFYGPGWDWDEADLMRVVREAVAAVRPPFAKLTEERDGLREERHSTNEALDDAVREAAVLRARVAELEAEQKELAARASRVAVSHEHFIQDHSDPGTEALSAQYELINWLARSEHHNGLPLNPVENALRVVLAELDQLDDEVNPKWIRQTIAEALPRDDVSDRRRRIYVDGRGDGWINQSVTSDGTHWLVQLSSMAAGGSKPMAAIAKRTGSLREIGRCW